MRGPFTVCVLALASWLGPQVLTVAAAQEQQPAVVAQPGATASTKPGAADGVWSPALTGVRRPLYRLRPSDVLEISLTFSPELNQTVTVQPDGYLPLKGADPIYAEGETLPNLRAAIRRAYTGILHDPEVTIVLRDFDKPYFVAAGEVGRPGKYELRSDTTVSEAVAVAGGFTSRAKHSQVVLFRRVSDAIVESHLLNVKSILKSKAMAEDIHLQPGDMLFIPQNLISKIRQYLPTSSLSLYAAPTQF